MERSFGKLFISAFSALALTALSFFYLSASSIDTNSWGLPIPYFEKVYSFGIHTTFLPLSAAFDYLFWFLLSVLTVHAIGLARRRSKAITRDGTGGEITR